MSTRTTGRWLLTAIVGIMLSAAPATAFAAQANEFGAGHRGFDPQAVPATLQSTNDSRSSKYKKVDDDDGGDFDFGFGFGNPGWGGWYGSPYWGSGWGPSQSYYYSSPHHKTGEVKIQTHMRNAKVYVDGSYAGTVKEAHKLTLRPGSYNIDIRAGNGQTFSTRVYVSQGSTVHITPDFSAAG